MCSSDSRIFPARHVWRPEAELDEAMRRWGDGYPRSILMDLRMIISWWNSWSLTNDLIWSNIIKYIYIYYAYIYIIIYTHITYTCIYKWDTDIVVIHIAPKLRMKMDRPPILNLGFGPSGDGGWTSSSSATVLTYTILHYFLDISGQSNMVKFWVFWRMCHCHAEIVMYVKVSLEGKL